MIEEGEGEQGESGKERKEKVEKTGIRSSKAGTV
jgi:hypothetical protein